MSFSRIVHCLNFKQFAFRKNFQSNYFYRKRLATFTKLRDSCKTATIQPTTFKTRFRYCCFSEIILIFSNERLFKNRPKNVLFTIVCKTVTYLKYLSTSFWLPSISSIKKELKRLQLLYTKKNKYEKLNMLLMNI